MTLSVLPIPLRDIALGQIALVACCLVYLAWWCVAFRPGGGSGGGLGYALLAVTIMLAGVGMSLDIAGLRALWDGAAGRMALRILIAGVIAYPLLLLVTMRCFHRVPTTELLLIVAWAVLEALVVTMLVLAGLAADGAALPCALAIAVATAVGLACYLVYYRLAPWPAFYCGMVPLGLDALAMAFVTWRLLP